MSRYNPSKEAMRVWKDVARQFVPRDQRNYKGPVVVEVHAYFERPLSHLKRGGRGLRSTAPELHYQKPDCDNLAKFVGDCLTGLAYHDDCQICDLRVLKGWSARFPRTEVKLKYLC